MKQKITIYDYENKPTNIEVDNFESISCLIIQVLSGDEVALIVFKNGDSALYDSSETREEGFFDGFYLVKQADLKRWNNYSKKLKLEGVEGISYERLGEFSK